MNASRFVVVVGCGRLGAHLAEQLSQEGNSVVVVDVDTRAFEALSAGYGGFRVEGDGTELAVLERSKVGRADLVMAVTSDDNANLMVAQVAVRHFGVARAVARVLDPSREEVFGALGFQGLTTVCPVAVTADLFLRATHPAVTAGDGP
ncbi:MAG: TrkA family potassium uptake protein [Candidatus Latescibacterota bacterium]